MDKLVLLKIGEGNWEKGFSLRLQIGRENLPPSVEMLGKLPPAPDIPRYYDRWQAAYRLLGKTLRLEPKSIFVSNFSWREDCTEIAQALRNLFNQWLQSEMFRPISEKLLEQLNPSEFVRLLLQTEDFYLQRLPWHLWDWFERYPKAEIALCAPNYERVVPNSGVSKHKVRILAIIGNSKGIDTQTDRKVLSQLPNAKIQFLVEPDRKTLTEQLWDASGWDIIFFAGHSDTYEDRGRIYINQSDSLTISQLKYALKRAVERGLKIAIFNSCDGLTLAQELAQLQIPQMLIMREPVPDQIAQEFLKYFLAEFVSNETFYLSVRQAREKLQGLEDIFHCGTWLPVIYQNSPQPPPTWQNLLKKKTRNYSYPLGLSSLHKEILLSAAITFFLIGLRYLGMLQPLELMVFDRFLQLRPPEKPDSRLLIVTVTESDIQAQDPSTRRGSLSDTTLKQLLQTLAPLKPRLIGLDIYRDFPSIGDLSTLLSQQENLIGICKGSDRSVDEPGISPAPEIPTARVGFSDFIQDPDGKVRRHLLALNPEPTSPCPAAYAFSTQLALHYLAQEGIFPQWTSEENLQLGKVVFKNLSPHSGGYQGIDAWGHQVLLNYRSPQNLADRVTLTELLEGHVDPRSVQDKIVLIGTTAQSFGDFWLTPYTNHSHEQMSGVLLQAQMTSQILSAVLDGRSLLWVLPLWGEIIWICLWSFVGTFLGKQLKVYQPQESFLRKWFISMIIVQVFLSGSSMIALIYSGIWLPVVPSTLALIATNASFVLLKSSIYSKKQTQQFLSHEHNTH